MLELKRKRSFTDDIRREVQPEKKLCYGISNEISTISPNICAHENQITALDLSTRPRESVCDTRLHIHESSADIQVKQTCNDWTTMDVDVMPSGVPTESSMLPRCAKCAAGQGEGGLQRDEQPGVRGARSKVPTKLLNHLPVLCCLHPFMHT